MAGNYNAALVLLSFLVAAIASFVALDLASRVSSASESGARYWLIGGAFAMGIGIWSMHFIGMLAFSLPIPLGYDVSITLLSLLIAMIASGFALFTINRNILTLQRLLASGVLMGIGIAAMHYVGMAAMRMSPPIHYDPLLYAASIAIAIAASMAALWISYQLRSDNISNIALKRVGAATVMGSAIAGMHYTGMAAANFAANSVCLVNPQQIGSLWMAMMIAGCTLLFLSATMAISVFDARLASNTAKFAKSVVAANEQLKEEIGERKRAENALQRSNAELIQLKVAAESANQAKSDFLANVSHELRTPLTLILAPLEQMLASAEPPSAWRAQLERVQRNALLLLNRVNDILDYSKAEANKFDVRLTTVNLYEYVPTLIEDILPVAQQKHCTLTCSVDPALNAVALDRTHFEKILLNLLSNAIKFTPAGGWIRAELSIIDHETFELAVIDSGIGIEPDKIPMLFRRFEQVDASTTRSYGGTGIGLALVKQLAALMGGEVGVESIPGQGARFYVRLPRNLSVEGLEQTSKDLTPVDIQAATQSQLRRTRMSEGLVQHIDAAARVGESADRPTVLIADDNPDMLAYESDLLSAEYKLLTARHGREAWAILQQQHVDVVLSDVMMPEMDGLALTAQIKKSDKLSHIPVILVTARGGSEASVVGLEGGADDYVAKPFSPPELLARVHAALRMSRVQRVLREKTWEAGMAIVATGILHNLGNILNGVSVSSGVLHEKLHHSKIPKLQSVAKLLQEHISNLPEFIGNDARGKLLPEYISELSTHLEAELQALIQEVETLRHCTEHVMGVINTHQHHAHVGQQLQEVIQVNDLMEKAHRLSAGAFKMHSIDILCDYQCDDSITVDAHKVLQILLNLLRNACYAVSHCLPNEKRIRFKTYRVGNMIRIEVTDSGMGIDAKHLPFIFNQGFTTKSDGHGFGLHSSANWAKELGGRLSCHSDGPGQGATFVLELPCSLRKKHEDVLEDLSKS